VIGVDVDGEGRVRERVCWEERCYGNRIVILVFLSHSLRQVFAS
jgi:hypothetical protein